MFKCVVISKDQPEYISQFESALANIDHVYVLDRCTKPYPDNIPILTNNEGTGFLAGKARNIGAEYFNGNDILFLDGDKPPVVGDLNILNNYPEYDCILLSCENDNRLKLDKKIFKDNSTIEYHISDPINPYNYVFSCGILLRHKLISYLKTINDGYIFNPCFYGNFGEEDTWIGDCISFTYNINHFKIGTTREVILNGNLTGLEKNTANYNSRYNQLQTNFIKRMQLRWANFSKNEV